MVWAVSATLVLLLVTTVWLDSDRTETMAVTASAVVAYVLLLSGATWTYLGWRRNGSGPAAWLVAAGTMIVVQELAWFTSISMHPERGTDHAAAMMVTQTVVTVAVLGATLAAARWPRRIGPLVVGLALGLAIIGVRSLLFHQTGPSMNSPDFVAALAVSTVVVGIAIAVVLTRIDAGPAWIRTRVGVAIVLLGVGHVAAAPMWRNSDWATFSIACNIGAIATLSVLSITFVRGWIRDNDARIIVLSSQLDRVQSGIRADRSRLHEVRATMAGLSSAFRLVKGEQPITTVQRDEIERMMESELQRLERLMNDLPPGVASPIDLDAAIEPVVTRHRICGYPIVWQPSGQRACGAPDHVSEVLNVLLENAYQHAPQGGAWIKVRCSGACVEVVVSDSGPGVDHSLRATIFDWGERSPSSSGEGVGLNVARELSQRLGGYLRLVDSSLPGATFVLGLPSVRSDSGHAVSA